MVVVLGVGLLVGAQAQQVVTSRLQRAVLFKQGYGLLVREVTLPAGVADVTIADMPAPVHGTFWVLGAPRQLAALTVTAAMGERQKTVPAVTLPELLRANIGEQIEVKAYEGWISGTLLSVAVDRRARPARNPEDPYQREASEQARTADLLVLRTAEGTVALPVSHVAQVRKAQGAGELKMTFTHQEPGAVLRLRTDGQGGTLQIAYLTYGLTWAPSYRLELGSGTAHLLGKSVILNEAEDIETPELACVAGFPNMKFAQVIDPLNPQVSLAQFFASLRQPGEDARPGVTSQIAVTFNTAPPATRVTLPGLALSPGDTADLHLYRFRNVTVAEGERVYLPLLDQQVTYKEVYRWNPRGALDTAERDADAVENQDTSRDVWHLVRLHNTGAIPWTTAPVMITQGDALLGQDILNYTPGGSTGEIRITKAINVKTHLQEETEGGAETTVINKITYRKFTMTGTLHVSNGTGKAIYLEINLPVTGDLISTSLKPTSTIELPRTDIANAHRAVTWETTIPAGGSLEIVYTSKVFLR
jgi:hypothetical protein